MTVPLPDRHLPCSVNSLTKDRMSRFLSRWHKPEYSPLTSGYTTAETSSSSSSGDEIDNEKNPTRWASLKQLTSASRSLSLLVLVLSSILRYTLLLLPSFIPPLYRRLRGHPPRKELRHPVRSTAYLDGLRGVAALIEWWDEGWEEEECVS